MVRLSSKHVYLVTDNLLKKTIMWLTYLLKLLMKDVDVFLGLEKGDRELKH